MSASFASGRSRPRTTVLSLDVLLEVLLEEVGLHLHVVVDEDDDPSAREVDAALPRRRRARVLLPLDAERVARLHEAGELLARVLLRAVVDRDDLVTCYGVDRLGVELLEEPAQEVLPVVRRDDDAHPDASESEPRRS